MTSGSHFGIRAPGFQPWPTERRDAGWPGTSGQPLDTLPSVPRANELRNLAMLGDSNGNGAGMRVKPEMSGQQSLYHALSTWLVIRNINPRVDSTALRSLCQQHGPLLTFQLNLRYGNSLIRYGNKDEAAKAHASLNGLVLAGSRLTADFATDSDIGSFFEQNSDWSAPQPTTWANAPTSLPKTEQSTPWPGSKPLFPPANFSSELWSYNQAGGLASGVWSTPPTSRRDGEHSTAVTENGITSPSMVTFLPPGLLNSGEST
ncbi:trinucleotide repeat-containing gene 6A isoform X1 [Paramuricea clavata]|uniref:Trinucleotide repeat-containing gene 6A isoform X1 n=1 Tax=Paramuricea clavata TaxID=317549 RepID=A0A6S7GAU7_PARCT|nr:trinucleotide repeat-containing gene 6A isoform X1 [Paramuricea clavata]